MQYRKSAPLHWCCDERPCSGTALYTKQISAQPPVQCQPSIDPSHPPEKMHNMPYIAFARYVNQLYISLLISACCNLTSCSPLKTVFNKLGDTYQAYCNTYKTHTMATHHGSAGQPLDRDTTLHGQDTDIPNDYHHEDMDNFENAEQESTPTWQSLLKT